MFKWKFIAALQWLSAWHLRQAHALTDRVDALNTGKPIAEVRAARKAADV